MIWKFSGVITSKQILPNLAPQYFIDLDTWRSSEFVSPLIEKSQKSAEIVTVQVARDILSNMVEKGEAILSDCNENSEISFVTYCHDAKAQSDNHLSVVVGLSPDNLRNVSSNLDQAMLHGNGIGISSAGGFSVTEGNPHSKQPTRDSFEIGQPLQFQEPVKIVIYANRKREQ